MLKERLLAQLPVLRAQSKGRDILLASGEDIGEALGKACEQDCDTEAVHIARAAQIVRRLCLKTLTDSVDHSKAVVRRTLCQTY